MAGAVCDGYANALVVVVKLDVVVEELVSVGETYRLEELVSVGETYSVDVVVLKLDELNELEVLETQSNQTELVSLVFVQLPPPYDPL